MSKKEISFKIDNENFEKLEEKLDDTGLKIDEYLNNLVNNDLNSKVYFEKGFYFDKSQGKLFNNFDNEVELTKIELKLFILLMDNCNNIVPIDKIADTVWKGRNMTRFTLRNKVKTIRDKTYYEIIRNHSNIGYEMNC